MTISSTTTSLLKEVGSEVRHSIVYAFQIFEQKITDDDQDEDESDRMFKAINEPYPSCFRQCEPDRCTCLRSRRHKSPPRIPPRRHYW